MTVSTSGTPARAAGNGVSTVYNFSMKIFDATDLVVRDILDSTGVPTTKAYPTDYSVTPSTTGEGGSITFTVAPAVGHTIDIRTVIPLTQPVDIRNQGRFLPEIHENEFDRLERQIQDTRRIAESSIHFPDYEVARDMSLPKLADLPGKYIALDANGKPFASAGTGNDTALRTDLANGLTGPGADLVASKRTAAEIALLIVPLNYIYKSHAEYGYVMPERYGAVGNGNAADVVNGALDSAAIVNAVKVAVATGAPLYLSRQYIAVPTVASTQEGMAITCLALMQSNLHVVGERGASITMANGQSTDAAPKNLAFFHTNQVLSNVSFRGVIFDMNGANNLISPGRLNNVVTTGASGTGATATLTFAAQPFAPPVGSFLLVTGETPAGYNTGVGGAIITASTTTSVSYANATTGVQTVAGQVNGGYNSNFNQAAISVSGTPSSLAARIDQVLIEGCTFKNNPGSSNIVCGQTNNNGAAVTFTGALSAAAVAATMTASWANATGVYLLNFSSGEVRPATFTNGSAAVTWGQPLFGSATTAATYTQQLGKGWTVRSCKFLNNGGDHLDHTSIFGWCDKLLIDDCEFDSDLLPHTIGLTGPSSAWELHGSDSVARGNKVRNYRNGCYIAANNSGIMRSNKVHDNVFRTTDWGCIIFRLATQFEIDDIDIHDNDFFFDNYQYIGANTYKAGVLFQGQYTQQQAKVSNVKIHDNEFNFSGTSLFSYGVRWETVTNNAGNICEGIRIEGNEVIGATNGVYLLTNAANPAGTTTISRNKMRDLTPDILANPSVGILVDATGGCNTLAMDANEFVDDRGGGASFATAIRLQNGTITDLYLGPQTYKGLTAANFNNASTTITRQIGPAYEEGATVVADGGTISFNGNHAGLTPKSITCTGSVAGEFVSVTTFGATTFTVAIKKWTGGALTAGTSQTVYWRVKF